MPPSGQMFLHCGLMATDMCHSDVKLLGDDRSECINHHEMVDENIMSVSSTDHRYVIYCVLKQQRNGINRNGHFPFENHSPLRSLTSWYVFGHEVYWDEDERGRGRSSKKIGANHI